MQLERSMDAVVRSQAGRIVLNTLTDSTIAAPVVS